MAEEEDNDHYNPGAKVSVEDLMKKDQGDESLQRYKQQLLGNANLAAGKKKKKKEKKKKKLIFGFNFFSFCFWLTFPIILFFLPSRLIMMMII